MKIILTFTLLMIPGVVSSMRVTGYSGGGVMITCGYDEAYRGNEKYFCKGQWSTCTDQIKTEEKNKWVQKDRFSLYDDTTSGVFTVTIRDLSERDSGTHYCGTENFGLDPNTKVDLKVITDQQNRSVRGYSGGNIIINFKYEKKHKNHEKYVCKSAADQCFTVINTNRAAEWKHDRRFSVHDDRSAGLLRLFIRELNENDSGEYNITVKVSEEYSFFSEFNLNIRDDDCCVKSISLSAAAGGSVNISCKYPQSHRSDVKFLCWRSGDDLCAEETSVNQSRRWSPEGKIQLYDDREEQLLTGSISHVTEQHSEYWCGVQSDRGHKSFITRVLIRVTGVSRTSTSLPSLNTSSGSSLIIVLVLVLLVLIIAGLSLLFLCKKHQSRGGDSPSQTGPREHEVVSYTGCDYEEIKDTHKQLPTNPSSNCVYATVQKATGDSQCCITSAEDLNYAVVNFHKESDCPDSVSIRNNQDYSEYAAVSHLTA
ncbi:polymeric immunoglobulin receptor-like isoform X27 [Ctenopharyngodon idella]|uniref:polymeric immunoglobulin receptor-like isoform X26 n=1 Tax=Ctenopharyngodon idella TaxID=7959 RepID=UPI00222E92FB|nr:polymeric immunoglobulin receptor-like isoform X26 [Ctenopharyngodon idella]XP_051730945.1 polymeric immunoglobulin receptor-like isoform X27 [Ctenopharyngodon idella]